MRSRRRVLDVIALLALLVVAGVVADSVRSPQITWTERLVPLVLMGVVYVAMRFAIRLPSLKADAIEIRVADPTGSPQRMPRLDLAFIFRGQMLRQVRYGSFWDKCYVFASSDGTARMWSWSFAFQDDGVAEFAQRLQVPIRGDFSKQVRDRVT